MKYCLTDCTKMKLKKGKKAVVELIAIVTFVVFILIIIAATSIILGFIVQGLIVYINGNLIGFPHGIIETGSISLFMLVLLFLVSFLFAMLVIDFVYKPIKALVTNTITTEDDWDRTECSIFEKCKEKN